MTRAASAQPGAAASDDGEPDHEELLFGGPLRYDMGWNKHQDAFLQLNLRSMVTQLPKLLSGTIRLARHADRRALRLVAFAEVGRGVSQAVGLIAVNRVLSHLLDHGTTVDRLSHAAPALVAAGLTAMTSAILRALSTAGTGQLEPKVERVATEMYLSHTANVELAAIEDEEFHRLLDSAQYGAGAARRLVKYNTSIVNALMSLIATAGVLSVLHPFLLPMLVAMSLPSAWAALSVARRRYLSFHAYVQHARAGRLISSLLISTDAAPEIRVHGVAPFLLRSFRAISESQEAEQKRLSRLAARTGLIAAAWSGLAAVATYATLGGLLWTGAMALSVGGTAVLAIRNGASSLQNLVQQINSAHEDSLFIGDLHQLCGEADTRAIPTGGLPLPELPKQITFEDVHFTYQGKDTTRALAGATLTIPMGKVVALVGDNASGKSTLTKLLCGLYQPDAGRILWDDTDAALVSRTALIDKIAIVGQDFYHWPFTAAVNIAIGRPDAPIVQERLDQAIESAGATELVKELPRGIKTLLARGYKGGHNLSGGQWQRLGIGRAHYRAADVLIVDEPTAALDAKAEQEFFDNIRTLAAAGQTVLLTTHRLGSVRTADLIHVLDHGRVVESGTFDELLDDSGPGFFRDRYRIQAAQYTTIPTQSVTASDTTASSPR
ncbi:ATP-binding cassette, subfamily B [Streptomyces sp. SceaMP-e96]|uniref:ABC transporter ATP-binding protein n=1 Tax=Streptomyces TaxID=1883 RepID=UPI0008238D46|nr:MULTISPECIES: ABC transporter ATP-binding protein [unclassified Streptomyces]MYT18052.1 ATP-binding cassette domain-containing protein [Streptomyces sp. SID4951]SCK50599.1 ATP-binding cassette, subfamily B [Streptomyces sp. SceaMP-e96]